MSRKRRVAGTAVYGTVRTVVWEDGGREPSSYPILRLTYLQFYGMMELPSSDCSSTL